MAYRNPYGTLKTTMNMAVLHCKTALGVHKELLVFAILYNLVRLLVTHPRGLVGDGRYESCSFLGPLTFQHAGYVQDRRFKKSPRKCRDRSGNGETQQTSQDSCM